MICDYSKNKICEVKCDLYDKCNSDELEPGKIYIAGKISGLPWTEVVEKFQLAKSKFLGKYSVVLPTELCRYDFGWKKCMSICLPELLDCTTIYMLEDWEDSLGATMEHDLAKRLDLKIIYQKEDK